MKLERINLFGKKVFPIGLPSGCVATDPKCAARLLNLIEEIGLWASKSYTKKERIIPEKEEVDRYIMGKDSGFREPILEAIGFSSFVNAVGLTNPGCEKGRQEIINANIPEDRIILGSSAGNSPEDFIYIMKTLDDIVDAHEMNVSCPHAEGMGIVIGSRPELVYEYVSKVVENRRIKKPIIVKLPPVNNIREIAKAAINAGAFGLSGINTVPAYSEVLTSGNCGISGRAIFRRALRCVKDMRDAVGKDVFIQGMGGVAVARDAEMILKYVNAIAIGSAFTGMTEIEMKDYSSQILSDINNKINLAEDRLKKVDTAYYPVRIREVINKHSNFKVFRTDIPIKAEPGQFLFAWIPGVGEKPFSIMDDNPLTLGVLERGKFTKAFNSLKKGDSFYVRGPYGQGIDIPEGSDIVLVGGGCGIAGIYFLAKKFSDDSNIMCLLGAKNKNHVVMLEYFKKFGRLSGRVQVATEDGSLGKKGIVSDLFNENYVREFSKGAYFFNCGPRAMTEAVLPLEQKLTEDRKIHSSVDYMTRCGVGICGSCADEKGRRTCIEGPFINQ